MKTPLLRVLLASALLLASTSGCQNAGSATVENEPAVAGHVHGLGVDPADGRLYVAAHRGLFVLDGSALQPVGGGSPDLMGFSVAAPGLFLASGHPGLLDLPNPLGLVRSDDRGRTWEQVSLGGQADLHALDGRGRHLVAYDGSDVLKSDDSGRSFVPAGQAPVADVAVDDTGRALVTTNSGRVFQLPADGRTLTELESAPELQHVAWSAGQWAAVDRRGRTWRSNNGMVWEQRGAFPATPVALAVDERRWFIATESGLYLSADAGHAWERL